MTQRSHNLDASARWRGLDTAAKAIVAAVLCLIGNAIANDVRAQDTAAKREDQFKAAYLFNFVKFVEWPEFVRADELTICFVGSDGVRDAFAADTMSKRVGARRLITQQLDKSASVESCNALYLDADDAATVGRLIGRTELPILTVSDGESFTANGGMIALFTENNRLRFNINLETAQKAGLRISSNLLQLAASVERGAR